MVTPFQLATKPREPQREDTNSVDVTINCFGIVYLETIVNEVLQALEPVGITNVDPLGLEIDVSCDCERDHKLDVTYRYQISSEEYEKRMEAYLKELEFYNQWYQDNKKEIRAWHDAQRQKTIDAENKVKKQQEDERRKQQFLNNLTSEQRKWFGR